MGGTLDCKPIDDSIGNSGTDNVRRVYLDSSLPKKRALAESFSIEQELIVLHAPSA